MSKWDDENQNVGQQMCAAATVVYVCVWHKIWGRKRTMDPKTKTKKGRRIECKCEGG